MFLINSRWIKKELDGDIHNFTELNTDINCFNDDDIEVEIDQEIANLTFTSEMEAYRKLFMQLNVLFLLDVNHQMIQNN